MKTKVLLYSLLFFLLLSCNNSRKSKESSALQITSISIPENLNISTPINSLFSEIKLLPLETKQGYEIADIFHFIVYDSLIIINDDRKKLLIFNNNGKLIRQIGRQGEGPGEYLSLRDFYVNDQKEILFVGRDFRYQRCQPQALNAISRKWFYTNYRRLLSYYTSRRRCPL